MSILEFETIFSLYVGEIAPDLEAEMGEILSQFPAPLGDLEFGGYTECFEWCEATQKIIEEIIHGMEENPPS